MMTNTTTRGRTLASLLAALLLLAGCGTGEPLATKAEETGTRNVPDVVATNGEAGEEQGGDFSEFDAALDVSDQSSDGATVAVAEATIEPAPGWVLIFDDEDGAPGQVIGSHELEAALQTIEIDLDRTLDAGEHTLWAQIHVDADPIGRLQWPGSDIPVTGEDGDVVQASFTVSVEG